MGTDQTCGHFSLATQRGFFFACLYFLQVSSFSALFIFFGEVMLLKTCSHCGKQIPITDVCDCRKKAMRRKWNEYNRTKRNKERQAFYQSLAWRKIKEEVMSKASGIDEVMIRQGKIVPANTVHHIIPLGDDWSKGLDISNLIAVSKQTHSMIHSLYKEDEEIKKKVQMRLFEYVAGRGAMKLGTPPRSKCFWN